MFKVKTAIVTFFTVYPINYGSSVVCSSFFKNWPGRKKLFQISNKHFKSNKILSTPVLLNNNIFKILSVLYQIFHIYDYLKKGEEKKVLIIEGASWVGYSFLTFYFFKKIFKDVFIIYKGHSIETEIRKKNNSLFVATISKIFEKYIYKHVDLSTSVSQVEKTKIKKLFGSSSIIFPNIVEIQNIKNAKKIRKNLFKYVFYCGSYLYKPNKIVIDNLIEKIMPKVRKKNREIELVLTGSEIKSFNEKWIHNIGHISKKRFISILRSSICMAVPSQEGYGTRVKIIEALCYGGIILTTPVGIEGIRFNKNSLSPKICKNINKFPDEILRLYKKHYFIKKKIKNDIKVYSNIYSARTATKKLYDLIVNKYL